MKYLMNFYQAVRETTARTDATEPAHLGVGSWILLGVLLALLAATSFVAYLGWTLEDGIEASTIEVSPAGYVAMAAGVLFSVVVGSGLMTLIFYSSRSGYDEPPVLLTRENDAKSPHPPQKGPEARNAEFSKNN